MLSMRALWRLRNLQTGKFAVSPAVCLNQNRTPKYRVELKYRSSISEDFLGVQKESDDGMRGPRELSGRGFEDRFGDSDRGGFRRHSDRSSFRDSGRGDFGDSRRGSYRDFDRGDFRGQGRDRYSRDKTFLHGRDPEFARPNLEDLPEIEKNFYNEHEITAGRSEEEIEEFRRAKEMRFDGTDVPKPILTFDETPFPKSCVKYMNENWGTPTAIQSQAWPVLMSGRDMVGIAATGSGKTAAFILPALMHILGQSQELKKSRGRRPAALVMVPTRELAMQVAEVAQTFASQLRLRVACVFGGASVSHQERTLHAGVDLVIATPGRLNAFISDRKLILDHCTYVVLDESDRMLDMGFEPQIKMALSATRPDRQTVMFSATWPTDIRSIAMDYMHDFLRMSMGSTVLHANKSIKQLFIECDYRSKDNALQKILNEIGGKQDRKTLIFVNTKRLADDLHYRMRQAQFPVTVMHGNIEQNKRTHIIESFKAGRSQILIATDVAARGIDVSDVAHVVNYDFPSNIENYVHRIGRTARGTRTGTSYTLITPNQDCKILSRLLHVVEKSGQSVPEWLVEQGRYTRNFNMRDRDGSRYGRY